MTANVFYSPILNAEVLTTANGAPAYNANIEVYYARTTTNANVYTSNTGATNTTNPIQIGNTGRLPSSLWIPQGQATKFVVKDAQGRVIQIQDDIIGVDDPSTSAQLANVAYNTANVAYLQANAANSYAQTAASDANTTAAVANAGANTMATYVNGNLLVTDANINFDNTSTVFVNISSASINSALTANINLSFDTSSVTVMSGSLAANGYANLTSNITYMWGSVAISQSYPSSESQSFTIPFPAGFQTKCYSVVANMSGAGSNDGWVLRVVQGSITTSQFEITMNLFGTNEIPSSVVIYWQAVGV